LVRAPNLPIRRLARGTNDTSGCSPASHCVHNRFPMRAAQAKSALRRIRAWESDNGLGTVQIVPAAGANDAGLGGLSG
jgi:hypothetical protein